MKCDFYLLSLLSALRVALPLKLRALPKRSCSLLTARPLSHPCSAKYSSHTPSLLFMEMFSSRGQLLHVLLNAEGTGQTPCHVYGDALLQLLLPAAFPQRRQDGRAAWWTAGRSGGEVDHADFHEIDEDRVPILGFVWQFCFRYGFVQNESGCGCVKCFILSGFQTCVGPFETRNFGMEPIKQLLF